MSRGGLKFEGRGAKRGALAITCVVWLLLGAAASGFAQPAEEFPVLRPIRTELPPTFWEQRGFCIGWYAVEAVAFIGLVVWLFTRPVPPTLVPLARRIRAELEQLRRQPQDAFTLSQISQCVRRYYAGAFELPAGELTTAEFSRALAGREAVGARLADQAVAFLQRCDAAKFSAAVEMNLSHALAEALELVAQGEARREELQRARVAAAGVMTS